MQTLEETKARTLGQKVERRIFPSGKDKQGRSYDDYRWSKFKDFEARDLYQLVQDHVFPFLRTLGGDDSTYATHMKDARFTIPTPALLVKVVDMIAALPMQGRDMGPRGRLKEDDRQRRPAACPPKLLLRTQYSATIRLKEDLR